MTRGEGHHPLPPLFSFNCFTMKKTFNDLSLSALLNIQQDLDGLLQKYALVPQMEKVRLACMAAYPSLLDAVQQKKVEAEETEAAQQQAMADAEAEAAADEGRLF